MSKIFISYVNQDRPITERLINKLSDLTISGWLDQADIAIGEEISSAIRKSIKESSAILVLVSPASIRNKWVQFEVSAAQALDKVIIPIIINGKGIENKLPPIIADIQYIDARNKSFDKVAAEIKDYIK